MKSRKKSRLLIHRTHTIGYHGISIHKEVFWVSTRLCFHLHVEQKRKFEKQFPGVNSCDWLPFSKLVGSDLPHSTSVPFSELSFRVSLFAETS